MMKELFLSERRQSSAINRSSHPIFVYHRALSIYSNFFGGRMKLKSIIYKILGGLLILASVLQFSGSTGAVVASQPMGAVSLDGGVTVSPTGPDLTATRAWTRAEMLAAKPYPLEAGKAGAVPTVGLEAVAGVAGSVSGGRPSDKLATPLGASDSPEDLFALSGPSLLGYGYPAPFTRQDLRNITTPYSKWPFITIGKLFFTQMGGNYVCSASVIGSSSASRSIITAGHCLHAGSGAGEGWSYNVVFVPAYNNGAAPYGQWVSEYASQRVFTAWYSGGNLARDIAGTKLLKRSGLTITQKVGWLGFAWNQGINKAWWQIGYPQAAPFDGKWMIACQASYAYNSPFGTTPKPIGVGCDQTGGTSGGPWVLSMGSGNWVNGVQSHRRTGWNSELFSPYIDTTVKTAMWDILVVP
jgi:V8-like Glu-specific endopeptidase